MEEVLGYPPEERVGSDAFGYVHPEDLPRVSERFRARVIEGENVGPTRYRLRHVDGSWRWVESRSNARLDDPEIEGIVVITRDVHEREQRELERERAEHRYNALLENTNDAIARVEFEDDTPIVRETNPAFADRFVPSDVDPVGRDIDEVVAAPDRRDGARALSSAV